MPHGRTANGKSRKYEVVLHKSIWCVGLEPVEVILEIGVKRAKDGVWGES